MTFLRFRFHAPRKLTGRALVAVALCVLSFGGCAARTGTVRTGPHLPKKEPPPIRIRTAPPPTRVEVVPLRRNKKCSYVDGSWVPEGSGWVWQKGSWVLPAAGCYYATPQVQYEDVETGTALVYRPGAWHPLAPGDRACKEPKSCPDANEY